MNEMMAADAPVPMDLGNVCTHDTKMTQNDSDMSNDMSYEDVCATAWKGIQVGREQARRYRMGQDHGIVEKELMNGRVAREMTEARKAARRANSMDEEDDQTSSWESEPEGENAEELASLETPDEEGEWCWPKKSRFTGWERRIDSRPAFHNLAEDDEGEQASGGLNHLVSRNA